MEELKVKEEISDMEDTRSVERMNCTTESAITDAGFERPECPSAPERSEEQPESPTSGREKKRRGGFWKGLLAGVVLAFLALFLYRGYIFIPVGREGVFLIKFPYYEQLHGASSGHLDHVEVIRKMREIENLIDKTYLYEVDPQYMEDGMFTGMIYGLTDEDNYAAYYSATGFKDESKKLNGSYVGIGITATKDIESGGVRVESVASNGSAREKGIEVGDVILKADGIDLTELTLDEAISHITGAEGSDVVLTLRRGEEELEITVTRKTIRDISVRTSIIPGTNIGYLSISGFTNATEGDFYEAIDDLTQDKEADGIVIDLRNNGGGDMNVALRMADSLLRDDLTTYNTGQVSRNAEDRKRDVSGKTLLLSVQDRNGESEYYYAEDGWYIDLPIAVIVNGKSASASEIFAGVLMDYGYPVVGEKTFGKGIVQSLFTLSDRSAVKFTTDKYILPDGQVIHGEGIEPSVPVSFAEFDGVTSDKVNFTTDEETDITKDNQVMAALDIIQSALSAE